jgi:hypothetical protein
VLTRGDVLGNFVGALGGEGFAADYGKLLAGGFVTDWVIGFMSGSAEVVDKGVEIIGGKISEIIGQTIVQAYQVVQSKKYAWSSTKTDASIANLGDDVNKQFSLIFAGIAASVSGGAEALGISSRKIQRKFDEFELATIRISLQGLDSAARQEAIEAVFSRVFDDLTLAVIPFMEDFQQVGEGLGETLARVATNVQVTDEAIYRLGFNARKLGVEQFAKLSTSFVEMAGGLDSLVSGMDKFITKFADSTYQFDLLQSDVTRALDRVGLSVPETREEMWQLMQTLDASTESGQRQIATLLNLAEISDKYYKDIEKQEVELVKTREEAFNQAKTSAAASISEIAQNLQTELSGISGALSSLSGVSEGKRSNAIDFLTKALQAGDLAGTGAMAGVAAQLDAANFSTLEEFARERGKTVLLLDALEKEGTEQLTIAEQSLNTLNSIDSGIKDLRRVMKEMSIGLGIDMPAFASGGTHDGGLRLVGENGPEIEMTGPSRIMNNRQLSQALAANTDLVREIRNLQGYLRQTSKHTGETRDQLRKWDRQGIPEERLLT